jgi:hypothetical protein
VKRRLLLGVAAAAAVVATGVTALAGQAALQAADDLQRAQGRLVAAREPGSTVPDVLEALRRADADVDEARQALSRWPVDLVAAVPVLGRSWRAERAVASAAHEVVGGVAVAADGLPRVRASAGGIDLAGLAGVRADLAGPAARSRAALQELERVPTGLTPPQVSRGVADARAALRPAVETLQDAERGLDVVGGLLGRDGPRSLLVMLQNNAELRGAGGYAASFATGRLEGGRLSLDPLRDVAAAADPPDRARRVAAPEEYVEDYGHLSGNTTIWRSWNMSPHVPDSALVGARVAGALLPQEPDVVVLLDVPAMAALAGLGGKAVALPDGTTVTPDQLTEALLVDAYADAGEDVDVQLRRRAALQGAATAAVTRMLAGAVPAADAARTFAQLAGQRHLSVWSARAQEQTALTELGLAGAVEAPPGGDLHHVSVNNVGANKLDYYVDRDLQVAVEVGQDVARVEQRVRFRNDAPAGLVPYVAGFDAPGVVASLAEVSLPPGAQDLVVTVDGKPWRGTVHAGGGRQRVFTQVELPRGTQTVLEVRYVLPIVEGRYVLRLVPQPLVTDADLRLTVRAADGERLGAVTGATAADGVVDVEKPLSRTQELAVGLEPQRRSRWERVKDWWNSPVQLG